jgi:ribonuclease P protein component
MPPSIDNHQNLKPVAIKQRAGFLAVAAHGRKWVAPGLILQLGPVSLLKNLPVSTTPPLHYGLTASKKVGNAVQRNRARRRLRELARLVMTRHADPAFAYVLIARTTTVTRDFTALRQDLTLALQRLKVWRDG